MTAIETIVEFAAWGEKLSDASRFAERVHEAASSLEPRLKGSVALLLAGDDDVRALNERFRGKDAPTNVLSFPSGERAPGFLGDIAIAFETCAREADDRAVEFADHAAHLIVHGLLHLVGYDHIDDADAERMERLESDILEALGVSSPYLTEENVT